MRKAYSLRPGPASSVICGLEAMPVTIGILASAMIFMVARCGELQCAPSIATTLASTSLLATLTPSEGLHLLSSTMISTLRPSSPPAALISSSARSTPHISHSDAVASGPVLGVETPITMGGASACRRPRRTEFKKLTAAAATQNFILIVSLRSAPQSASQQHCRWHAKHARDAQGCPGHQRFDAAKRQP